MLVGVLCIPLLFTFKWPRKAGWLARTAAGRALNNYNCFWWSHNAMFAGFYLLLWVPGVWRGGGRGDGGECLLAECLRA
jgi:hypothetical protein